MKKGFTLIELLAVIVILAIIALIVVPIVINIINNAKEESDKRSAELYVKGVEQTVADYQVKNTSKDLNIIECLVTTETSIKCKSNEEEIILEVKIDGKVATDGIITFEKGKIVSYEDIKIEEIYVSKNEQGEITTSLKRKNHFLEDSWDTISNEVKNNKTYKYRIGDTKEVDMGNLGIHTVRISNNSTPSECSSEEFSQTACGFVIEFVDIIAKHRMNDEKTNVGGWEASEMRTYLNNQIYKALPDNLKEIIIETKAVSGHCRKTTETNFITIDKLYLLSIKEIYGTLQSTSDTSYNQTRQLDYYEKLGVTTANYGETIKKYNENSLAWWLRSPRSDYTDSFHAVLNKGNYNNASSNDIRGISPAFRIG